jgi:hypothetical protein
VGTTLGNSASQITVETHSRIMPSEDPSAAKRPATTLEVAEDKKMASKEGHYMNQRYSQPRLKALVRATDHLHPIGDSKPTVSFMEASKISIPNVSIPTLQITATTMQKSMTRKDRTSVQIEECSKITTKNINASISMNEKIGPFKEEEKGFDDSYEYL